MGGLAVGIDNEWFSRPNPAGTWPAAAGSYRHAPRKGGCAMRKLMVVLPVVLLFGVSPAGAQSVAPVMNAQDVPSAKNDQSVSLRGEIVSQQARNEYLLTDGTGNVLVEIGDDLLKGNRLAPGTEIEIEGKVDIRLLKDPEVDARRLTVLALHDVVPPGGKPGLEVPEPRG
jgi:uncharacterized protein (TIGR00156 family)